MRMLRCKVVSFEAPEVFLTAEGDGENMDPTQKVVIYGSVTEQPTPYELQWTQVGPEPQRRACPDAARTHWM